MIKTETKAKQNITKQLKLDLKFFKSEVQTMEQLKTSLSGWYYREKMTDTIIKNINSDKYDLKQAKEVISKRLNKFYDNKLNKVLADIESVKKVDKSACRWGQCMIDWNRNATWGNCPKGSYRNGHAFTDYRSVTGCGYDKLSTLTANMFNDDKYLISFILDYCEKHNITNDNIRERLGYGIRLSTISNLPYFEGAVGVECHINILKRLGFKVAHNETKKSDFIEFERITK
ncbi:hypothetical protein IJ674_05470 [bacterium]|nr:hypothetical protein [bacterium]